MTKQEFSGKTLDEALINAARGLGTEVSLLSYNILPQSSGGLLSKLFQRGVRLEAWIDNSNDIQAAAREAVRQAMSGQTASSDTGRPNERDGKGKARQGRASRDERPQKRNARSTEGAHAGPRPRSATPETPRAPRADQGAGQGDESTERIVRPRAPLNSDQSKALLLEMGREFVKGYETEPSSDVDLNFVSDEEVIVSVKSEALEEILVKSDRLSCAFEHLFKRISQKRFGDVAGRVTLTAGNALELREEKLKEMALSVAAKVKETGKTITLSSKSSQERRVIHLALENMDTIGTKSVGIGDNRKLIVFSTDKAHRSAQSSRRRQQRQRNNGAQGPETQLASDTTGEPSKRSNRRRGRRGGQGHRPQRQSQGEAAAASEQDSDNRALSTDV